jgi:hypothetical protein
MAEGSRTVTIKFLGQTFEMTDTVEPNSEGVDKYQFGLKEESSILAALAARLAPKDECDEAEEPAAGTEPDGG